MTLFEAGGQEEVRAHVEGQLWAHPNGPCGRARADRAGAETGGPAPHALGPLVLEGLPQAPRRRIRTPDGVGTSARSLSIYSSLHACSLSFMIQLKQEPVLHALHLTHQGSVYNNYRLLQVQLGNSNEWLMRTVILNSSNF